MRDFRNSRKSDSKDRSDNILAKPEREMPGIEIGCSIYLSRPEDVCNCFAQASVTFRCM